MTTYTGTPKTWVVDEFITATDLNAIRDFMLAVSGAWNDDWSPAISQGTATNIGRTVNYAQYVRIGSDVRGECRLSLTQNGGGTGPIRVSVPVTASTSNLIVGSGTYLNQDGTLYPCIVRLATTGLFEFVRTDVSGTSTSAIGTDPAVEASNGDAVAFIFSYEA